MGHFKAAFQDNKPLLLVILVYIIASVLAARAYGMAWSELRVIPFLIWFHIVLAAFWLGLAFVYSASRNLYKAWRDYPLETLKQRHARGMYAHDVAFRDYFEGPVFPYAFFAFLTLAHIPFFLIAKSTVYMSFKFKYDALFAHIDKVLHFGHYPHEFIIPLCDALRLSWIIDICYGGWAVVLSFIVAIAFFFDGNIHRRMQFLWTYILGWILLGSLGAILMSSAGPLFYGDFHPGPNPYADLLVHFKEMASQGNIRISDTARELLLKWTNNHSFVDGNSISSMPSMHVAMAWLFCLYARRLGNKPFFIFSCMFFPFILVGSVYNGMHYAIDGYFSIITLSLIWWLSGKWMDRKFNRDGTRIGQQPA